MKILISLVAFAFTLALTSPSLAADGGGHGGGHGDLSEKMNALFPPEKFEADKNQAPDKPELASPAYFAKITGDKATLTWKAVATAQVYHVQVATDANFKWLVANNNFVKETSFDVSGLEAGKHYFWRVAAVKSDSAATHTHGLFATSMFEVTK